MPLPTSPVPPQLLFDLALVACGATLGALGFSLVVGRFRSRQLAHLADRLARVTGEPPIADRIHVPDPVLTRSLRRLASRIASVEAMADTDLLTGVVNRQACLRVLSTEIERANRYRRPLSIALFDIDHFKRVNDTYGHAVGDLLLQHVAGLLGGHVRGVDTLGRYGGEEFLLVMPETDLADGTGTAENLRRLVARSELRLENATILAVTVSAGVAGSERLGALEIDELLHAADYALYTAKALGRDQVSAYRDRSEEAQVLRAAIDPNARSQAIQIGKAAFRAAHKRLRQAISDRPDWAGGPSQLMADLSGELARAVGLPEADVERIRTATLLHDLGNLAIPTEILAKPTSLTEREWLAIIEHPKVGQVVLEQAGAMRDAAVVVLHHHEWFNGRGYPHGLAGTEIPVGARILAITDAYEAMVVGRPYKPPVSHEEAIAELRRNSGVQFDPDLVATFIALYGEEGSMVSDAEDQPALAQPPALPPSPAISEA